MADDSAANRRAISITRISKGVYEATNNRGGTLRFGSGDDAAFTPVELLLVATGGCAAIDVDWLTSRRAEPESFDVVVSGHKASEGGRNQMADIDVCFDLTFPDGDEGDRARDVLPAAIERSHDRLCTVSRTVHHGAPVTMKAADCGSAHES